MSKIASHDLTVDRSLGRICEVLSGFVTFGSQDASNCIAVLNGANACRDQALGGLGLILIPRG